MNEELRRWLEGNAGRFDDVVSAARAHQIAAYAGRKGFPAEVYVAACGSPTDEDRLVLIMGEVVARIEAGEDVLADEYQQRFPDLADALALQFQLLAFDGRDAPPLIPGYRIGSELGRGCSATVYRATQEVTGREVALKVLAPDFDDHPATRVRFLRESELHAAFDHPNLIRIVGHGVAGERLYLAMELATEGTLADRLAAGTLPLADACGLVAAIAEGVAYAHDRRVIHRDIKPSNVLFVAGVPKLTDFGLAKQIDFESGLTSQRQFVGTAAYAAPEQAVQAVAYRPPEWLVNGLVGASADVYSLGVVLFECLTGRLPVVRDTVAALCEAKLSADPPDPRSLCPDLPAGVAEVCRKSLARSPAERYPTVRLLTDALRAATVSPKRRLFGWIGG